MSPPNNKISIGTFEKRFLCLKIVPFDLVILKISSYLIRWIKFQLFLGTLDQLHLQISICKGLGTTEMYQEICYSDMSIASNANNTPPTSLSYSPFSIWPKWRVGRSLSLPSDFSLEFSFLAQ